MTEMTPSENPQARRGHEAPVAADAADGASAWEAKAAAVDVADSMTACETTAPSNATRSTAECEKPSLATNGVTNAAHPVTPALAVFAGTVEGRSFCEALSSAGVPAVAFVATEYGNQLMEGLSGIQVRMGRLGAAAMEEALAGVGTVVDATHPYAVEVSRNIRQAAAATGAEYVRIVRECADEADGNGPDGTDGTDSTEPIAFASAAEVAAFLEGTQGNVLLTTGSKELAAYATSAELTERLWPRFLPDATAIERALELGYKRSQLICMQGPFSLEMNVAMLKMSQAKWLVTKDGGKPGGFAEKIQAADQAGARVLLIRKPEEHETGLTLEEAIERFV
ncbi:MAG: precorrin-6A reductase [Eggerthellaceae bacterium]